MKIVVLNESFLKNEHIERLKQLGEVEIFSKSDNEELIIERLNGTEVAIADMFEAPLNAKVFSNTPSLKYLTVNSTGYDLVDIDSAKKNGVAIGHVPGFSTQGVAEHAIALIFATLRHIPAGDKAMRSGPFQLDPANRDHDRYLGTDIHGKTIGIIGFGQIGSRVAELANALGMNVLAYNRSPKTAIGVKFVELEELLKQSDIISLNGALTEDQEDLINESTIELMKPTAIIINTARGGFINDNALATALKNKRLAGAGLDFLKEWTEDNPLLQVDNVVLTPHVGWFTEESLHNMADIIVDNVESYVNGDKKNLVE